MTVSTDNSIAEFSTNGITTNFPFYFKFMAIEDLVVTYVNPAGVSNALTLGGQYTVSGAGDEDGGSVITTTALAGPGELVVSREMDAFRLTSLRNQGKLLAETHENVFDRRTMLIQQGYSGFARALKRSFGRDYFSAENRKISNVADPTEGQDAVTRNWVGAYIDSVCGMVNNIIGIAYDGMTLYDYLRAYLYRSVDSIRDMQLVETATNVRVKVYSYYGDGAGGGDIFRFDPTMPKSGHDGGTIISPTVPWDNSPANLPAFLAKTGETDPSGVGCWVRESKKLSAMRFGALVDGTGDNTAALAALVAKATLSSLKRTFIDLEAGDIAAVTFPNWAVEGIVVRPKGRVFFTNNGIGDTVIIDAGPLPAKVSNVSFGVGGGQIIARGGPATMHGFNVRNILRSKIIGRVYGCGVTSAGLYTRGAVLNSFDVNVTNDESGGWYLGGKPMFGYMLADNGVPDTQTAYNTFYASVQSCEYGIWLQSTLGNYFPSGDAEYCTETGIFAAVTALNDKFNGIDLEVNTNRDIDCGGQYIEFRGCDTTKVVFNSTAKNCQLVGGNHDAVQIIAGATDNLLSQIKYCRGLGAAVITDAGTRTRFKDNMNLKTGRSEDAPQRVVAVIVTLPFSFANNTGNPIRFHMAGGTIGNVTLSQNGFTAVVPYPMAPLWMLPGETVTAIGTVAPPDAKYFVG
ncbi:hypothetical protein [Pseudomonas fluorescens]|uniref:Uncharacterized protein n=1 Tax=Pseudomonas fluorescens TaxID=294 RepID=A0A5E7A1H9_PSEFL|nr:hypothetical protein [Pseudomonas fluorescens]VVN70734.1 hypothetical protein PS723_00385 [Pseudomonas fluorescens]